MRSNKYGTNTGTSTDRAAWQLLQSPVLGSNGDNPNAAGNELRKCSRGLVIDLRGNCGGSLAAAAESSALFMRAGLGRLFGRSNTATDNLFGSSTRDSITPVRSQNPNADTDTPILLLTDSNTASASEVLASALIDSGRAVSLGSKTLGKNVAQVHLIINPFVGTRFS